MKILAPLFPLLLAGSIAAQAQTIDGYTLVWHDEFDTDGPLSPADWNYEEGFVRNNEWQWYQPANATCRDGVLVLTARNEHRPNPTYSPDATHWGQKRQYIEMTSASVTTRHKHEFLYGRFEVRARIPAARGSWPAIWFHGDGLPWPECGEIDLMEFYERGGQRSILANTCWGGTTPGNSAWETRVVPFTHFTAKDSLWATQFHTWRMDWDEHFIRLYLDDELLNETSLEKTVNGGRPGGVNPFRRPMYIILNLAMGSSGGRIDESALPMRYEVDYVRVYRKDPAE